MVESVGVPCGFRPITRIDELDQPRVLQWPNLIGADVPSISVGPIESSGAVWFLVGVVRLCERHIRVRAPAFEKDDRIDILRRGYEKAGLEVGGEHLRQRTGGRKPEGGIRRRWSVIRGYSPQLPSIPVDSNHHELSQCLPVVPRLRLRPGNAVRPVGPAP